MTKLLPSKHLFIFIFILLLTACGSEDEKFPNASQSDNASEPTSDQNDPDNSDVVTTPEPVAPEVPSEPSEPVTPTPPSNPGSLSKPEIATLSQVEDSLLVYWNSSNASQYRIIYWRGTDTPGFAETTDKEFISPDLNTPGQYTVIVEAYDALGNSLFSDPETIDIL